MKPIAIKPPSILILGDALYETFAVPNQDTGANSGEEHIKFRSGVWMVREMIEEYLRGLAAYSLTPAGSGAFGSAGSGRCIDGIVPSISVKSPQPVPWIHAYEPSKLARHLDTFASTLAAYPQRVGSKTKVYRVSGRPGWVRTSKWVGGTLKRDNGAADKRSRYIRSFLEQAVKSKSEPPAVIIIDDRDRDFRTVIEQHKSAAEHITELVSRAKLVIWLLYGPLKGSVWHKVSRAVRPWTLGTKSILVTNRATVVRSGITVPHPASFETTLDSLFQSKDLRTICACRSLLVQCEFGTVHLQRSPRSPDWRDGVIHSRCFTDQTSDHLGHVPGETLLLVATLVCESLFFPLQLTGPDSFMSEDDRDAWLIKSLNWSAYLAHRFFLNGFASEDEFNRNEVGFAAVMRLVKDAETERDRLVESVYDRKFDRHSLCFHTPPGKSPSRETFITELHVPCPRRSRKSNGRAGRWSRVKVIAESKVSLDKRLRQIVVSGLDSVAFREAPADKGFEMHHFEPIVDFPYAEFGKARVFERHALDDYLHLFERIREYVAKPTIREPLSIAVFGPPGSGKNFMIRELVSAAAPSVAKASQTFNLSQFQSPEQLWQALRKVQSLVLSGNVPLITFDEFDVHDGDEYKWPKFFLGPMEDGKFFDGHDTYLIGRCIFLFAGGTRESYDEFRKDVDDREHSKADDRIHDKLPDFHSRLRGAITIRRLSGAPWDHETLVRRAIILRTSIENDFPQVLRPPHNTAEIEDGLIDGFLKATYRHDVRSMKAVLQMMARSGAVNRLDRSMLPSDTQLKMHVEDLKCFRPAAN